MNRSGVVVYRVVRLTLASFLLGAGMLMAACSPRNMAVAQGLNPVTQTHGIVVETKAKPVTIAKTSAAKSTPRAQPNKTKAQARDAYSHPQSYTLTKGEGRVQGGLYDYFDNTGEQLIDGIIGGNDVLADLGRGQAYEWVGWGVAQPMLQFRFARSVNIKRVEIRFNRNDKAAISLPSKVIINGVPYRVNPEKIPNQTSGYLGFEGAFVGRLINIQITRGKGWVFVDEVRFVDP